jgi:hypothetical protein
MDLLPPPVLPDNIFITREDRVAVPYAIDRLRRRSTMDRRRGAAAREFEDFNPACLALFDQDGGRC